jgi:Ca2+-binding RTX toxin-like protein
MWGRRTIALISAVVLTAFWLQGLPAAAAASCGGQTVSISGDAGSNVLYGTAGPDVIAGGRGNDTIYGRGGDDVICGGYGADQLNGGTGDDWLYGGMDRLWATDEGEIERIGDTLRGGAGDDRLVPGLDDRSADSKGLDWLVWDTASRAVHVDIAAGSVTGQGHDRFFTHRVAILGSPYGDTITGSGRADHIYAAAGGDIVRALGGADTVYGDNGQRRAHADDRIFGGPGNDAISTEEGEDEVHGGSGRDFISDFGNSGDILEGNRGRDTVIGEIVETSNPQRYAGGRGIDRVELFANRRDPLEPATGTWNMQTGVVRHVLENSSVTLQAPDFERVGLNTWHTTWTVEGTPADDEVDASGSTGTTFHGRSGDDLFSGSASDDVFYGGPGDDRTTSMGAGEDTCIGVENFDYDDCEHITP